MEILFKLGLEVQKIVYRLLILEYARLLAHQVGAPCEVLVASAAWNSRLLRWRRLDEGLIEIRISVLASDQVLADFLRDDVRRSWLRNVLLLNWLQVPVHRKRRAGQMRLALVDVAFWAGGALLVSVGGWLRVARIEILLRACEVLVTGARRGLRWQMLLLYCYAGFSGLVQLQLALELLPLGRSSLFLVLPLGLFNFGHF